MWGKDIMSIVISLGAISFFRSNTDSLFRHPASSKKNNLFGFVGHLRVYQNGKDLRSW